MKIYKLDIDTSKPITQRRAIPQDADKYGLVVSANNGKHPIHNLSCTIFDGDETLTPSKTLDDGSLLFVMSSTNSGSRAVKVKLAAKPLLIEGATLSGGAWDIVSYDLAIPAGTYYRDELDLMGYYGPDYPFNGNPESWKQLEIKTADKPYTNVRKIGLENEYRQPYIFLGDGQLPSDAPLVLARDVTYKYETLFMQPGTEVVLDTHIGNTINCTINLQLDEVRGALPDGEITDDPAVYDDVQATSLSVENIALSGVGYTPTTINIGGTEYKVLAATANI